MLSTFESILSTDLRIDNSKFYENIEFDLLELNPSE
jgi:hypothetical protein